MRLLRLFPDDTKIPFMRWRKWSFLVSGIASVLCFVVLYTHGMNTGIDFQGGTLMEIQTKSGPADLEGIRSQLNGLGLGEVQVQSFGTDDDVLIRIARQEGGDEAQAAVVTKVQAALGDSVDYRRTEMVGPRVSGELAQNGILGIISALCLIMVYVWFRFEWQYSLGAVIATLHDVVLTIGFFAVTQVEFNLSSIAAILTIVGYSLNDTVVVYDRIREMRRKYKRLNLVVLLDLAINQTLTRTTNTALTTLIALAALVIFGGEVIRSFTASMLFGVLIGTYSSIFIAAPVLIFLDPQLAGDKSTKKAEDDAEEAAEPA
ncbi:protein translocase subunit SecF [Pleomorphomonas sp. NRK KF1]|uniref:protein translocase subunit SecF n=1 Tax=Pleomorphomonas sp. NRK KF1 TaxID=2943000 RepID=UPI00204431C0|nr:protein translocase subunit SecF [Pleomorphomonas sp. NRK KF1]MCM5551894.1 protein translocase subunit SecF [Pleomorphomonas sp. NRK KF1]